ncbi:MAG: hypothetical protein IJ299_04800, partial [Oscillospiraceae bacterium]|nr:hypothetical protein [Oscillospiraceae bacterium]
MRKGYLYLAGLLLLVLLCAFVACDSFSGGGGISDKPDCDHDIVKVSGKEATCTENGWNSYEKCDKCGYTTYSEVPALGHDTVWHEGKFSTCTEIGWTEYVTCNRCDYSTYEEAPARGHSEIVHDAKAPTCTEIGWD